MIGIIIIALFTYSIWMTINAHWHIHFVRTASVWVDEVKRKEKPAEADEKNAEVNSALRYIYFRFLYYVGMFVLMFTQAFIVAVIPFVIDFFVTPLFEKRDHDGRFAVGWTRIKGFLFCLVFAFGGWMYYNGVSSDQILNLIF